jgi:predicted dehydrogenase
VVFQVCNPVFHIDGCDFNMEDHTRRIAVREYSNAAPGAQESNMFSTFAASALSGKPDAHWAEVALKTQEVVDACLASARSGGRVVELNETSSEALT